MSTHSLPLFAALEPVGPHVRLMLSEPMAGTSLNGAAAVGAEGTSARWCCSWRRWRSGTGSPCTLSSMPTPWTRAATPSVGRACSVIRPSRTCGSSGLGVPGRAARPVSRLDGSLLSRAAPGVFRRHRAAMISQEIRAEFRRLVLRDGWKIETVARRFGVHHSVVRRMIRDGAPLDGRRASRRARRSIPTGSTWCAGSVSTPS